MAADVLRSRREALGLSRERLAVEAGCSYSFIVAVEKGYSPTTSQALPRVLRALDELEQLATA